MYMLKLAGSILIIGTGILAGMSAADRVRQQYEEMRELQTLLYALRSEILYARACLGEAFLKIGRDAGEPYRGWMMEMSRKMERRQDRMLSVIWKTGVRDAKNWERSLETQIWKHRSEVLTGIWRNLSIPWKK